MRTLRISSLIHNMQQHLIVFIMLRLTDKEPACQCRRRGFDPWVGKIPWRRKWQHSPIFVAGNSHGKRSLEGYKPQGHKRVQYD